MDVVSVRAILEGLLAMTNLLLLFVGLKIKSDVSELKVFMFERFVTKDSLDTRLENFRENMRRVSQH
jgi:hypothetical protein